MNRVTDPTARNFPGMTNFQRRYTGSTPIGWSGIVVPRQASQGVLFGPPANVHGITFHDDVNYNIQKG